MLGDRLQRGCRLRGSGWTLESRRHPLLGASVVLGRRVLTSVDPVRGAVACAAHDDGISKSNFVGLRDEGCMNATLSVGAGSPCTVQSITVNLLENDVFLQAFGRHI